MKQLVVYFCVAVSFSITSTVIFAEEGTAGDGMESYIPSFDECVGKFEEGKDRTSPVHDDLMSCLRGETTFHKEKVVEGSILTDDEANEIKASFRESDCRMEYRRNYEKQDACTEIVRNRPNKRPARRPSWEK